jgi:hypothetical protein
MVIPPFSIIEDVITTSINPALQSISKEAEKTFISPTRSSSPLGDMSKGLYSMLMRQRQGAASGGQMRFYNRARDYIGV